MQIFVPSLNYSQVLGFIKYLNELEPQDEYTFNFEGMRECSPFPMLLTVCALNRLGDMYPEKQFIAQKCDNTYAQHMGFFQSFGLGVGKEPGEARGSSTYVGINKFPIGELIRESRRRAIAVQELVEEKSEALAKVFSRGNVYLERACSFFLQEIIRNVPEHSEADTVWYCAQYWPSYDLVEMAIADEVIGIYESLTRNPLYRVQLKNDYSALQYATPQHTKTIAATYTRQPTLVCTPLLPTLTLTGPTFLR